MAVRSSMSSLIAATRQLIGDVSTPQDFLDQDIQDVLDAYRDEVRYELLHPMPDIQPGENGSLVAQFVWASYQSEFQYWESDVVIQGLNTGTNEPWFVLTPASFEYIPGKWTFTVTLPALATPPGQYPPVYATGKVYDLYTASAALLERRIALWAFKLFDASVDSQSFKRSQIIGTWERLRDRYIAQGWNRVLRLERTDLAPGAGIDGSTPVMSTDGEPSNALLPGVLGAGVIGGLQ